VPCAARASTPSGRKCLYTHDLDPLDKSRETPYIVYGRKSGVARSVVGPGFECRIIKQEDIMFLDASEAIERLESTRKKFSLPINLITLPTRTGAEFSGKRYTQAEKVVIGALATIDSSSQVRDAINVNPETAIAYREGRQSRHADPDPALKERVDETVERFRAKIQGLASQRLVQTLEAITPEKIEAVDKVKDLAAVAGSLAKVNQSVQIQAGQTSLNLHYHVFKPRTREDDEYEVVEVEE
jgi:hypothetical protein